MTDDGRSAYNIVVGWGREEICMHLAVLLSLCYGITAGCLAARMGLDRDWSLIAILGIGWLLDLPVVVMVLVLT